MSNNPGRRTRRAKTKAFGGAAGINAYGRGSVWPSFNRPRHCTGIPSHVKMWRQEARRVERGDG